MDVFEPSDVHLWYVRFNRATSHYSKLLSLLSEDEYDRANRFMVDEARHRFVAVRAALRWILSHYLPLSPEALQFQYSAYGKPVLVDDDRLHFNIAHTKDIALCGVCKERPLGVDIEQHNPAISSEKLAQRFFTPHEYTYLMRFPQEKRLQVFYQFWTCKEAVLKAEGLGLYKKLGSFEIDLEGDSPSLSWLYSAGEQWYLCQWQFDTYHASVATAFQVTNWHQRWVTIDNLFSTLSYGPHGD